MAIAYCNDRALSSNTLAIVVAIAGSWCGLAYAAWCEARALETRVDQMATVVALEVQDLRARLAALEEGGGGAAVSFQP